MPKLMSGTELLGIWGIGVPKWLKDPYGYVRDKLIDMYNGLGQYVQDWIISPLHPLPGEWLDYMQSNAAGLAIYLIGVIGFITLVMMGIFHRHASKVLKAGIVAIVIGGLYPIWFATGNYLSDTGGALAQAIAVSPKSGSNVLFVPEIHNVLGAIGGILLLLIVGGALLLIFFGYEILFVIASLIGLPLLALSPLGEGFKRKFEQIVGIVIVTSFLGRLAAVGILSITTLVILHLPVGNSTFGSVLTLIAGFGLAIIAQFYILKHADKIYGNITGRTLGTSKVTGFLETKRKEEKSTGISNIQNAHIASVTSPSVPAPILVRTTNSATTSSTRSLGVPVSSRNRRSAAWAAVRSKASRSSGS